MNMVHRRPATELPHEPLVALVNLERLNGYLPDHYVALVHATGGTPNEALRDLERRAVEHARENYAEAVRDHRSAAGTYVVLGLRLTAGIAASGQPEWLAYGTLTRGHRSYVLAAPEPVAVGGAVRTG